MFFLDRYEFEQILNEDLALNRSQWQRSENSQLQSSSPIRVPIGRTILIGLTAAGLGLRLLLHQPSFAYKLNNDYVALNIQQK